MTYRKLRADDPAVESFRGSFFKMRRALGTTAFGLNEIRMPAGFAGPTHDERETQHDEVYIVLEGDGIATIDGEAVPIASGDYLLVAPASTREIRAGDDGLRFIAIGAPAKTAHEGRATL
jgi:mannose-6-phosphate isomerase-like protein (cupin superfamily)